MQSYIIIHHTDTTFEVALFVKNILYRTISENKSLASKMLVSHINTLLQETHLNLADVSFVGINQGPGLFSTLRSIITTVNALHFSHKIPLVGIDALDATLLEFHDQSHNNTIVMLNAFNQEVYYGVQKNDSTIKKGYSKIDTLLNDLKNEFPSQKLRFIGNGTQLYKDTILEIYKGYAIISEEIPPLCSINTIAKMALHKFLDDESNGYLFPLHLKKHPVEYK